MIAEPTPLSVWQTTEPSTLMDRIEDPKAQVGIEITVGFPPASVTKNDLGVLIPILPRVIAPEATSAMFTEPSAISLPVIAPETICISPAFEIATSPVTALGSARPPALPTQI